MPLLKAEQTTPSRDRLIRASVNQGILGLASMAAVTILRADEVPRILEAYGSAATWLVVLLVAFTAALSFLKFRLTSQIFVSPAVIAYFAILPLLGLVLSCWIAVLVAASARGFAMAGIGPTKINMEDDPRGEYAKLFSLAGTYGLPMIVAAFAYEALGGTFPLADSSLASGGRICAAAVIFIAANTAVMVRIQAAHGYTVRTRATLAAVDSAIYLLGLPYSVLVAYCWVELGFRGIILTVFSGIVMMAVVRKLADARTANEELAGRLASLSNIGAAVSLRGSQESLLRTIYEECSGVIDTSLFTIALVDEEKQELFFALEMQNGVQVPPASLPIGEGLNSWVVRNGRPLLLRSSRDEIKQGILSLEDGLAAESWLGVPMVVQRRIFGVISVQSERKSAFREEDVVLMRAIACQAAVAIEDSALFRSLASLNAELEERVADRTNELRETNLQLLAADRAKTRFLANTSHELRTPLNSIIGFSTILREKTRDVLTPRLHGFIENIVASATHLLSLINDILDLSKVEAGKLELHPESFGIQEMVAAVERVIKGVAADASVLLLLDVDSRLEDAVMDEGRVKQILLNLLSNAVKFSPRGGFVRLRLERIDAVSSPLGCETVRLSVEDRGPGIAAEELPKIFEEFYQADSAGAIARIGTGLGLPLTKRFVEMHHGTIRAESELGVGTTITVDLPRYALVEHGSRSASGDSTPRS